MATAARTVGYVGKYAFMVRDLTGVISAQFQKASGIGMTISMGEYSEGGAQAPMKEATRAAFSNGTFEHGVISTKELYNWVVDVINMLIGDPHVSGHTVGAGVASPDHLRNFSIDQLKRDRTVLRTVKLANCQPASFKPGEFDNNSNDIQVEELELAYEYFTLS